MRRSLILCLTVAAGSTLLTGPTGAGADEPDAPACDQRAPTFRPPLRLGNGYGYEPGIEMDSQGTIFVTAHKLSLVAEGDRLASWLWRSTDDGRSFQDMSGVDGFPKLLWALEGDFAVDEKDRLYWVDTWAADNHFIRWSNRGTTVDFLRPFVASGQPVDDRPWLAAHGDGYVYYMGNMAVGTPAHARLFVNRSTDGGQTFDPVGFSFPNSNWGFLDADPTSPYVYAVMDETNTSNMVAWVSPDRGSTWTRRVIAPVSPARAGSDLEFPSMAVSPVDGTVYALWDNNSGIFLAESRDRGTTWTVHNVTPFAGGYSFPWVTVGPTGDVGIIFSADPQSVAGNGYFVYGMVWRPGSDCLLDPENPGSMCTGPSRIYGRLQPGSTGDRASQADFFQVEMSADNALNVPWTDRNQGSIIEYTRQSAGPNMDGTPTCGLVGTP
ncbi:MAG TPA: sialidase family protein [Actinomycetota bacterium]|nr:sialidase family protein [Actinomycetota bacterium]